MTLPFGETVSVLHPPALDRYGDPVAGSATTVDYSGCAVWPSGSTEQNFGSSTVTDGIEVLLPPGAIVAPADRLVIGGNTYQVQGRPFAWRSELTGTDAGVLVSAVRVTG